jgi:hypothetical protein
MKVLTWEHLSELKKRMKISTFFLLCSFLFLFSENPAQIPSGEFFLCFYNVENLFDLQDDPETEDEEFTPRGARRWTHQRLKKKLLDLSKVFMNSTGWEPPQVIMLCEVENRYVLQRLIKDTPLRAYPYKIIHKESPDQRGTDVALLYNEDFFYPLHYRYFPLKTDNNSILATREILYVSGIVNGADTLHIFVNHWPSRYGGVLESRPKRNLAAQILREQVEALQKSHPNPKIMITGDFNDQPTDESIFVHLNATVLSVPEKDTVRTALYNLSLPWKEKFPGTIKYRSQWSVFDQVIISGALSDQSDRLFTRPEWAQIVKLPFLLEKDEKYGGIKIRRTYSGFRYSGGTSDHLPVILRLKVNH